MKQGRTRSEEVLRDQASRHWAGTLPDVDIDYKEFYFTIHEPEIFLK